MKLFSFPNFTVDWTQSRWYVQSDLFMAFADISSSTGVGSNITSERRTSLNLRMKSGQLSSIWMHVAQKSSGALSIGHRDGWMPFGMAWLGLLQCGQSDIRVPIAKPRSMLQQLWIHRQHRQGVGRSSEAKKGTHNFVPTGQNFGQT